MPRNRIESERVYFGYTQKELADLIGVSTFSISNWEKDIGSCKVTNLLALSNVFGTTPDYLIGLTDERRRKRESINE